MRRLVFFLALCSLLLAGCGTVTVRGALNANTVVTSGQVSIVRLTFASDGNGGSITVTAVTLLASGNAQTFTFCGSQATQFPMDSFVTARFTQGTNCSTLLDVTATQRSG